MAKRHLTNLVLALVVTVGLMIPSVAPVGAADAPPLTGFAVCPWGSDDCNICVPDVPGAIRALRNRGDIMGFHIGDAPDPNPFADHWQGVQRTMSGGARYLLVSRSIDPATKDVSFVVVEMATRNDDGLRFRSNRLAPSIDFEFTPPPAEDRVVTIVPREGSYSHAGGMQLLGNVLAVPFESGESTDPPSKVVLFDVSNPPQPVRLPNEIIHAVSGGISSEAGTASLGKLADGRFLLVIGRGDANNLDFYVSTGSDIRTTAFERFDSWNEDELQSELCASQPCTCGGIIPVDCEFGNYQNLSLVHQCDGALYLVGTHQDSLTGEDFVDLHRLDNVPGSNDVRITKVAKRQLVCGYRGENHCNFDAAGGVYIDPERRLLLYGTEHDNDGPIAGSPICNGSPCSVKFEEFRPVPHGPCTRIADAWVELYDDTDPDSDRSIIIDFVDRELENYTNYNSIDDFEDKPSHALWCIPERATHRLWEDRDACGGDHRDLVGTGQVEEIGDLGGFETSCSEWIGGPFADAGEDRTVECAGSTTSAQLDGRASVSLEGGSLTFSWEAAGIVFDDPSSPTPTGGFPLGGTAVALTVKDSAGSDADHVTVTAVDTIAPTIACPADVVADATQPAGAEVNYPAPAASDSCGVSSLVCAPASGSTFPIGTTTTQCTATDAGGHTAACSFTVKVKSPAEQAADLIAKVSGLTGVKAATKNSLLVKLEAAQAAIAAGKQKAACGKLLDFINEVNAQRGKKELTEAQAADLIADATRIRGALGCS